MGIGTRISVSMLEAFEYAKANVELWYEEQGRLASEHAGLDDNGDALFSLDPAAISPMGALPKSPILTL